MFGNLLTLDQELPVQGASAATAARLAAKSAGIDLGDPYGIDAMTAEVMKTLAAQKTEADPIMVKAMVQQALASQGGGLIQKAVDPVLYPTPYVTPTDFTGQYPL